MKALALVSVIKGRAKVVSPVACMDVDSPLGSDTRRERARQD